MDIEKCKRKGHERRTVAITVKVTPSVSKKLKELRLSPTAIFHEALRELKVI